MFRYSEVFSLLLGSPEGGGGVCLLSFKNNYYIKCYERSSFVSFLFFHQQNVYCTFKFLRACVQLYILGNFGVLSLFVVEERTVVDNGVVEKGWFLFLGRNLCILFFFFI